MGAALNLTPTYGRSVKGTRAFGEKPTSPGTRISTLGAMTSLDREEFEALAVVFGEAWNHQEELAGREASTGGRPPRLRAPHYPQVQKTQQNQLY